WGGTGGAGWGLWWSGRGGLLGPTRHADRLLAPAFWALNIGLAMMVFMSLLPAGIYQAYHSVGTGLWYARSPQVVHSALMEALVWLRVPGDVVFAAGAVALALYAARLLRGPRKPALELGLGLGQAK